MKTILSSEGVDRRETGVLRLFGQDGLKTLKQSHAMVIGIGGVGSWVAEALARNALGNITLVDLDHIAESNLNRQIHALESTLGMSKVIAMQARIKEINPAIRINPIDDFIREDNVENLVSQVDIVIDAIDDVKAKVALISVCKRKAIPLITVGGAGGRLDPTLVKVNDLARISGDRLLAKVRNQLRRDHGFPKAPHKASTQAKKFGIDAVYSDEPIQLPEDSCSTDALTGLQCSGYGSSVCVTATFGFVAASRAIHRLIHQMPL
jgi:tRNA threonylcarbamoyladenosine dehydratase